MRIKIFYLLNALLLVAIIVSCEKETPITDAQNPENKTATEISKVQYVQQYRLDYIGNCQWKGYWNGIELIFTGPTDYQINDGLSHRIDLVSARAGSWNCETAAIGTYSWAITAFYSSIESVKVTKVEWYDKATGEAVMSETAPGVWLADYPATHERLVSYYWASTVNIGSIRVLQYKITVIQVNDHLELMTFKTSKDYVDPRI